MAPSKPQLERTAKRQAGMAPSQRGYYRLTQAMRERSNLLPPGLTLNLSYMIDGELDAGVLERCLDAMRERHGILRTRFFDVDGRLCLQVMDMADVNAFRLEQVDLTSLPASERDSVERDFQWQLLRRPYDLAGGEVMRAALVTLTPTQRRLTLCFHHIAIDGGSLGIFVDELQRLWIARTRDPSLGQETILGPTPHQYLDLADYFERLEASEAGQQQRRYWTELLHDAPALELPVDRPREAVDARRAERSGFALFPAEFAAPLHVQPELHAQVVKLARTERSTVFAALLAAMAVHVRRSSGQDDLSIVSHVHCGHLVGLVGAIGLFGNPLVMRIRPERGASYRQLIRTANQVTMSAYEHGDADVLGVARPPMFRLWFNYAVAEQITNRPFEISPGLTATPAAVPAYDAREIPYDLILFLFNLGDRCRLQLVYNAELFHLDGANAFVQGYAEVIAAMCRDPDATIGPGAPP